jgi:excisionase family DNA binding protein
MTASEAALLLGCSQRHVRTLINAGRLPGTHIVGQGNGAARYEIPLASVRRYAATPRTGSGWPRGKSRKEVI